MGALVTGFSVNLSALHAMQASMQRRVDDVSAIRSHLAKIDDSAFKGFLAMTVKDKFDAVLHAQVSAAVDAQTVVQNAANQIQNSAQYYAETDRKDAAHFDSMLPAQRDGGQVVDPESADASTVPPGSYADINHPQGRLIEPPSYDEEMTWKPSLESDLGSVTAFIRDAVKLVLGVDPIGWLEQLVAGDWKEVRRIADRFNNVAWAFRDACDDIYACANKSKLDWEGNTGDSMRNYVNTVANGFYGEYQRNQFLADQLTSLAEGVFDGMNVLTDLASDWINAQLIPAIASIGLAGVTQEIPIVDFITDGVAGYKAWEAIQAGYEIYDKANKIKTMIDAFSAALAISQDGQIRLPDATDTQPLPTDDTYTTPVGY